MSTVSTEDHVNRVEQRGPFAVTQRQLIHDRFGMQLIHDRFNNPDGSEGDYFWIQFVPAVLVFPVDHQGNLYLIREYCYAINDYEIAVPGGSIDDGETPHLAAKRELREELGLEAKELTYLGSGYEISGRVYNHTHLFIGEGILVADAPLLNPNEVISGFHVPLQTAYQMALDGNFTSFSVEAGVWRLKRLLDSRE